MMRLVRIICHLAPAWIVLAVFVAGMIFMEQARGIHDKVSRSGKTERPESRYGLPSTDYVELDGFTLASYGPASTAWVAYTIDRQKTTATEPRQSFHEASDVPHEFRPRLAWYEGWNAKHKHDPIQKGHLFPARAAAYSAASERACFEARNILPQAAALNVGPWKEVETREFELGKTNTVYVCCGPLWAPVNGESSYTVEMVGGIPKPPGFWKSILIDDGKTIRAESWIFPNRNDDLPEPGAARVSIDELESVARLNLWPDVPGEMELEAAK